jgi:hypothetical protein
MTRPLPGPGFLLHSVAIVDLLLGQANGTNYAELESNREAFLV